MGEYAVVITRSARKELGRLPDSVCSRVLAAMDRLRDDPRPAGVQRLHGASNLWRIRVGDYRIIYAIDDARRMLDVRVVRHRRDAYR